VAGTRVRTPTVATDRFARAMPPAVRLALGILWFQNVVWKIPPDFGQHDHRFLYGFLQDATRYPVWRPYTWFVEHVVLPHYIVFAWFVFSMEAALAVFLTLGLATRLWGVLGAAYATSIALATLNAPSEWNWSYYLMILCHLLVAASAAGRVAGLDGLFRPAWERSGGQLSRLLLKVS
jgi:thiosulfate dehydrogenase [quinone] large subunit